MILSSSTLAVKYLMPTAFCSERVFPCLGLGLHFSIAQLSEAMTQQMFNAGCFLVLLGLGTSLTFSLVKWRLAIDADLGVLNLTSICCGTHRGEYHHGDTLHYLLAQILWRYCMLRKSMAMTMAKDTIMSGDWCLALVIHLGRWMVSSYFISTVATAIDESNSRNILIFFYF